MANTTIRDNTAIGEPDLTVAVSPNSNGSNTNTYSVSNVGAYATSGDGRVFRFAYDGGTAIGTTGVLLQGVAQDDTNAHDLACATVAVGDTTVTTTTTTTVAANAWAGGYLTFTGPLGGQTYAIAGNTAASSAVTTITLGDPIRVALTTPTADITYNQYYGVITMPTTATSAPVGASYITTTGTQFCWIQTHGPIALPNDGGTSISVGQPVTYSGSTAGYICAAASHSTQPIVGWALETIEGTQWGMVQLEIE